MLNHTPGPASFKGLSVARALRHFVSVSLSFVIGRRRISMPANSHTHTQSATHTGSASYGHSSHHMRRSDRKYSTNVMCFWTFWDVVKYQNWRKGWDSNPRWACTHGGFQDRCLKPLGHPSHEPFVEPFGQSWQVSRATNLSRNKSLAQ